MILAKDELKLKSCSKQGSRSEVMYYGFIVGISLLLGVFYQGF